MGCLVVLVLFACFVLVFGGVYGLLTEDPLIFIGIVLAIVLYRFYRKYRRN